jgi:hypothetical protein
VDIFAEAPKGDATLAGRTRRDEAIEASSELLQGTSDRQCDESHVARCLFLLLCSANSGKGFYAQEVRSLRPARASTTSCHV